MAHWCALQRIMRTIVRYNEPTRTGVRYNEPTRTGVRYNEPTRTGVRYNVSCALTCATTNPRKEIVMRHASGATTYHAH